MLFEMSLCGITHQGISESRKTWGEIEIRISQDDVWKGGIGWSYIKTEAGLFLLTN